MTEEQRLDDSSGDAADAPGADMPRDLFPIESPPPAPVPVDEMIPEPPASDESVAAPTEPPPAVPESPVGDMGAIPGLVSPEQPTDLESALPEVEPPAEAAEPPAEAAEPAAEAEPTPESAVEVEPITAADIPALEGCDVEKSWSGDETCEGTEEIAEAAAIPDPEAGSELEAAEGELAPEQLAAAAASAVTVPTWPFAVYLVLWVGLCLLAGWQLLQLPLGVSISTTDVYRITVIGGVVMTVAGPLLIAAVWLASFLRAGEQSKAGLLSSALLKGAVVTFLCVIMWWATLLIVDQARLGRFM